MGSAWRLVLAILAGRVWQVSAQLQLACCVSAHCRLRPRRISEVFDVRDVRVVLIGGTSNVGKSTVAQEVAEKLGFEYLSTERAGPAPRPTLENLGLGSADARR